jgi:tetratricopeptide (TPR) repeat protein
MMADLYRVRPSYGGGHTIRPTTWEDHAVESAALATGSIVGNIIGASIHGLRNAARNAQDRKLQQAIDALEVAAEAEDFSRLLVLAKEFVNRYPQLPHGHASLAASLTATGQYDEAIRATERAEQLGLDNREAQVMRAEAYERKGSIGLAIAEWSELIRDDEAREGALGARARMLLQIGDLDLALSDINQSIAGLPNEFAYALRGDIYRARGELKRSIDDYTRAHRLRPDMTILLERRAEVYEQLGKHQEAEADRAAAKRSPEEEAARRRQEQMAERLALVKEAQELLTYLRKVGIQLRVIANGRDIDTGGTRIEPETAAKLNRLKPQLLALMRDE